VTARTLSILLGFQTFHPFSFAPSWGESGIGLLPWQEQVSRLRADADLRERLVAEATQAGADPLIAGFMSPARSYLLGDPPNYEPAQADSVAGIAAARGQDKWTTFLELLLEAEDASCSTPPSSTTATATSRRRERCWSTLRPSSGWATAAPTPGRRVTRRRPPSCSRTGPETAGTAASRSRQAVREMTSATADLYGLGDRATCCTAMWAMSTSSTTRGCRCASLSSPMTHPAARSASCSRSTAMCAPSSPVR